MQNLRRAIKYLFWSVAILLIVVFILGCWLYSGKLTPLKFRFAGIIPYPVALVGSKIIFSPQLAQKVIAANVILNKVQQVEADEQIYNKIFTRLIDEEVLNQIAGRNSVFVSDNEIDTEYLEKSKLADSNGPDTYSRTIAQYGIGKNEFKNRVIKFQLLNNKLRVWFNSQEVLNSDNYTSAGNILQKLQQGEQFETLANEFSDDKAGRITGGDLGFVDPIQLLPELREPVLKLNNDQPTIIPSRYGLHIFLLKSQMNNKAHLYQIFLENQKFESWYSKQVLNLKIKKLIIF